MSILPKGSCIAWWYLTNVDARRHVYIGVFLHNARSEFTIELAEGISTVAGWEKDDHIVRPNWSFNSVTRRQALAMVMKYATVICHSRKQKKGCVLQSSSFSSVTGTQNDMKMRAWELSRCTGFISIPEWWPTMGHLRITPLPKFISSARSELITEGFDIVELIKLAKDKARRYKRKVNGKVFKRIGRWTVYVKTKNDAPY